MDKLKLWQSLEDLGMREFMIIDPPSGWQYGFPRPLPSGWKEPNFDLKKWFLENGYPEKDIDLALKHSRYWPQQIPEN